MQKNPSLYVQIGLITASAIGLVKSQLALATSPLICSLILNFIEQQKMNAAIKQNSSMQSSINLLRSQQNKIKAEIGETEVPQLIPVESPLSARPIDLSQSNKAAPKQKSLTAQLQDLKKQFSLLSQQFERINENSGINTAITTKCHNLQIQIDRIKEESDRISKESSSNLRSGILIESRNSIRNTQDGFNRQLESLRNDIKDLERQILLTDKMVRARDLNRQESQIDFKKELEKTKAKLSEELKLQINEYEDKSRRNLEGKIIFSDEFVSSLVENSNQYRLIKDRKQSNLILRKILGLDISKSFVDKEEENKYNRLVGKCKKISTPKQRLIMVCPWVNNKVVNQEFVEAIEQLVNDNIKIDIGYGNLKDLDIYNIKNKVTPLLLEEEAKKRKEGWKYSGFKLLYKLSTQINNFNFKILGTHEKYIVVDNEFAIIGSHNFLVSNDSNREKEIAIFTRNKQIIKDLVKHYETSIDWNTNSAKSKSNTASFVSSN